MRSEFSKDPSTNQGPMLAAMVAADLAEREASDAHDAARATRRRARSLYRAAARAALMRERPETLPDGTADECEAAIMAAASRIAGWRRTYDQLCRLDESDAAIIDAAVSAERASYDYDALVLAYENRKETLS